MFYPLSYEGLRPISYRPGDIHECPGVPRGANRCHRVRRRPFRRWSEDTRSNFVHTRPGCPTVTMGAQG